MTIEQALISVETFEQWAIEKATSGSYIGRPGLANDCPICHYVKDVTGQKVFVGLDSNYRGVWHLTEDWMHVQSLTPAFETLRKRIDQRISISALHLVTLIQESLEECR